MIVRGSTQNTFRAKTILWHRCSIICPLEILSVSLGVRSVKLGAHTIGHIVTLAGVAHVGTVVARIKVVHKTIAHGSRLSAVGTMFSLLATLINPVSVARVRPNTRRSYYRGVRPVRIWMLETIGMMNVSNSDFMTCLMCTLPRVLL